MQGYRTLLANSIAGLGIPEAMSALHDLFPAYITDQRQVALTALIFTGMNIYLRFKTTTPVGQSAAFSEAQLRLLLSLIRREAQRAKESDK